MGIQQGLDYFAGDRVIITDNLSLHEEVLDFLGTRRYPGKGHASFDCGTREYKESSLVKCNILINTGKRGCTALIVLKNHAHVCGREHAGQLGKTGTCPQEGKGIETILRRNAFGSVSTKKRKLF